MILPVRPHFIFDLIPPEARQAFIIPVPCRESGSPTMLEWALLIACGKITGVDPETMGFRGILEIGTYKGMTARMLYQNFGTCTTLDLDPTISDPILADQIGATRRKGHSMTFDFSACFGRRALVFIDGGHDYQTVASDSQNALKVLDSGPAAIVWHDYCPQWPGVMQACQELAVELEIYHVEDTSLCIYLRGLK